MKIGVKCFFRFFFFLVITFSHNSVSNAQPYFTLNDSIPVKFGSSYITNPWAGGLNFIQISNIDLNQDGKKDLFVFDRTGNKIRTFINMGTPDSVDYKYVPLYENKFPPLHDWALLKDYNGDGKEDIFSYSDLGGGFKVYKNTSNTTDGLQFALITERQSCVDYPPAGPLENLYTNTLFIPAFSDIDNDGDLDVVTYDISATFLQYYQNQSMELYGNADSLIFNMRNRCWGYSTKNNNFYSLHDTCSGNVSNPELGTNVSDSQTRQDMHQGGTGICLDIDGDGDKDFIASDINYSNLTLLTNGGSPIAGSFSAKDPNFPLNSGNTVPVNLRSFPAAYYADVNNDGINDLVVSPNSPVYSENFHSILYYKNNGTNSFPVFQFMQPNLLQDNMIDVGEGAYPVFYDYNNDGLKDLFIGNYGYFDTLNYKSQIAQFKNTGTAGSPIFELVTRDYANLSSLGILNMVPSFGDLDGDGDADMIIGGYDGTLQYFENTAPAGATANFVLSQVDLKNSNNRVIDVGDFAAPQIVDVDGDGKNDLVIGSRNGKIAYYNHTGSATASIPVMDSITHFFGNIKVSQSGYVTGYSYPFLFKQNNVTKLLVGAESGYLHLYNNIDGNLTGAFSLADSMYLNIFQGARTAPNGTDIDNDGYLDLIVGNYEGGVSYYKGVPNLTSVNNIDNFIHFNIELFPNPANNSISIKVNNDNSCRAYILELYDIMGQFITSQKIINNIIKLNTEEFNQGVYLCKVSAINADGSRRTGALVKRIIIQHVN